MTKTTFRRAFTDTLPVLTGYLVLGMGFGIIMQKNGYGILWSAAMSLFIYAGSMQYAAVGLIGGNASLLTVALTTLAVNARHLFYGISMIDNYKGAGAVKPYLIFSLTDETYSLVCGEKKSKSYYVTVSLMNHFYWVSGTVLGALIGSAITFSTKGIDFALTALFITIFTEQWMSGKGHFAAVTGLAVSAVCLLIFGKDSFLIPAMLVITAILLIGMRKEKRDE